MSNVKLNRLRAVLDSYGADPLRWPDADRVALASLLEDEDIQQELRSARELDRILSGASTPEAPTGAQDRLASLAANTPQQEADEPAGPFVQTFGVGRFATVSTLAASLFIGIYIGTLGSLDAILINDTEVTAWAETDGTDDPFDLDSLIGADG